MKCLQNARSIDVINQRTLRNHPKTVNIVRVILKFKQQILHMYIELLSRRSMFRALTEFWHPIYINKLYLLLAPDATRHRVEARLALAAGAAGTAVDARAATAGRRSAALVPVFATVPFLDDGVLPRQTLHLESHLVGGHEAARLAQRFVAGSRGAGPEKLWR